jgi:DNA-binding transcriptional MerR regulator
VLEVKPSSKPTAPATSPDSNEPGEAATSPDSRTPGDAATSPDSRTSGKAASSRAAGKTDTSRDSLAAGGAGVTIAEAAARTGVSVHTLRYYERAGLVVTTVDRTASGRRRYHQLDLDWIKVCTRLRATGMPIRTIRQYAELVTAGRGNEKDRLELLETHRAEVLTKLAELQENLELIDHKIDVYRGRLEAGDADQLWAPSTPG